MSFFEKGSVNTNNDTVINNEEKKEEFNSYYSSEVKDVNAENKKEYDAIIEKSTTNLDNYYDKNSPFVKIFLLLLLVLIIGGVIYYLLLYLG